MRLIDADKLKNGGTLCKVFSCPTDEFYGMLQLIDEQPTVDDVDAVIAKLEKGLQNAKMHKEKHSYSDEFINGFINGYERALDAVKRDGRICNEISK